MFQLTLIKELQQGADLKSNCLIRGQKVAGSNPVSFPSVFSFSRSQAGAWERELTGSWPTLPSFLST